MRNISHFELDGSHGALRGTLHLARSEAWVIIVHGYFSSNRIGPYRLYFELAEHLRQAGINVARVDLAGMGESDGDPEAVRFAHHLDDYMRIVESVRGRFTPVSLSVVAHCAGCNLALHGADRVEVDRVLLIAPFVAGLAAFNGSLFRSQEWEELMSTGATHRNGWYCHRSFFDSANIMSSSLVGTHKSVLGAVFAGGDEFTGQEDGVEWAQREGLWYAIVDGADHNFTSRAVRRQLFAHTEQFLQPSASELS